jgi:multidrug efflux pump subunit AcrB
LSRDDSKDIKNAIQQVYMALLLGIFLSGIILYGFIRKIKVVALIFISVPVCLTLVMLAMSFSGFSLNVISLAGLALSVGLLLDAAIVVVDSILALQKKGYPLSKAITVGCKEVRSAIFSSTLSSIIIFIPILMINSAESQLFEDLAFTISTALLASLVVALVVLPAFARYLISDKVFEEKEKSTMLTYYLCASARTRGRAITCLAIGGPLAIWLLRLAPASLLRINKKSTISLALTPAANMPMSTFTEQVSIEVDTVLNQDEFSHLISSYRGSGDQLKVFIASFLEMFIFSLLMLVFLLWLSLNSWKLALAVMLTMPLAFAGGMLCLQILNLYVNQALDIITMIGFIILLGLVINNAILLASKYQSGLQTNLSQYQAITEAIDSRKRPIYMSTATSIFGMLPLMLLPGEGAEIYRGLAAVIIGGMTFSALFSLSFMAALLSMPIFLSDKQLSLSKQTKNKSLSYSV